MRAWKVGTHGAGRKTSIPIFTVGRLRGGHYGREMDSSGSPCSGRPSGRKLFRSAVTGRPLLLLGLTDLDGTANDEHLAEHARLGSIGPARDAFAALEHAGIPIGICTARSFGEAAHYRTALGVTGPLIAENGAVRALADGGRQRLGDPAGLAVAVERIAAAVGRRFAHSLDLPSLELAWQQEQQPGAPVYLGHPDLPSLRRAADRLASCFLVGLTQAEKSVATQIAADLGFDAFGELLHLIPRGADKGTALALLLEEYRRVSAPEGELPEVVPLVFGNGVNDLPLFRQAVSAGGLAVLVGDATTNSGFHFDPAEHPVPAGTLCFRGLSHGHAIRASLPPIAQALRDRHGLKFTW